MPAKKADEGADAPLDGLEMPVDGTTRITWDTFDVTLRRPKIREWLSFIEEGEAADAWLNETPRTTIELVRDGPYRKLYVRLIEELGGQTIPVDDLASWLVDGGVMRQLSAHWRADPTTRSDRAAARAMMKPNP